jgi:hypothetical protein
MATINDFYIYIKLKNNRTLSMMDFPILLEAKWSFFKGNWIFIKDKYKTIIDSLPTNLYEESLFKTKLQKQFDQFSNLVSHSVELQENPLSNTKTTSQYSDLFDIINIDVTPLSLSELAYVNDEKERISNLSYDDLVSIRSQLENKHDLFADKIGLGNEEYDKFANKTTGTKLIDYKLEDIQTLNSYRKLIRMVEGRIITPKTIDTYNDPFESMKRCLNNPEIIMNKNTGGFVIPFPSGTSLERLAVKYLGDANRWLEIAIANGLQAPFVDEVGRSVSLIANGSQDKIIVGGGEKTNLFIGMSVWISSDLRPIEKRAITNKNYNETFNTLTLTLSGNPNLNRFAIIHRSQIMHYAKNTVNGTQFILIPTNDATETNPLNRKANYLMKDLSPSMRQMGTDLRVSDDGDLVFDRGGDLAIASGMIAASQIIRLKFDITAQELLQHPTIGFPDFINKIKKNQDPTTEITNFIQSTINSDSRFAGVGRIDIVVDGGTIRVATEVMISDKAGTIVPITFELPLGR